MIHGGTVWNTANPSDWLDFSANLRPEGPPDWVTETLRSTLDDIRFYPDPDMKRARRGLAGYLVCRKNAFFQRPGERQPLTWH